MKNLIISVLIFFSITEGFPQANYCIENRFSESYYFDSTDIQIDHGVVYGISKNYFSNNMDTLKMDVFYPDLGADDLSKRPFIMLIHGGAFLMGARSDMYYQCMEYTRRGFVVATITYRLGWNCPATNFIDVCILCGAQNYNFMTATYCAAQDGNAAMRYITSHENDYGIDPDYLFIGGESAGAITALHTAFWDQGEANDFTTWAVGAVGLLDTAGNNLTNSFSIRAVIDNSGAVSLDSVVMNNPAIGVISFHDEFDCIVPKSYGQLISCLCSPFYWTAGSEVIYNRLTQQGNCAEYHQVPGSIGHVSYPMPLLINQASCFLKRLMCDECPSGYFNETNTPAVCDTLHQEVGIADLTDPVFEIFPNPANDFITIHLPDRINVNEILITDLIGRNIFSKKLDLYSDQIRIETTSFHIGVYFLNLKNRNDIVATQKVVIGR